MYATSIAVADPEWFQGWLKPSKVLQCLFWSFLILHSYYIQLQGGRGWIITQFTPLDPHFHWTQDPRDKCTTMYYTTLDSLMSYSGFTHYYLIMGKSLVLDKSNSKSPHYIIGIHHKTPQNNHFFFRPFFIFKLLWIVYQIRVAK